MTDNLAREIVHFAGINIHFIYQVENNDSLGYGDEVDETVCIGFEQSLPKGRVIYGDLSQLKNIHAALGKIIRFADAQQRNFENNSSLTDGVSFNMGSPE